MEGAQPGPPPDVTTGVLVGGELTGIEIEIEPGSTEEVLGEMPMFDEQDRRVDDPDARWVYRYVGIDEAAGERRAIFEFQARGPHADER